MSDFGLRLQKLRKQRGLTQKMLAERIKFAPHTSLFMISKSYSVYLSSCIELRRLFWL